MSHGWQAPFRVLRDQFTDAFRENFRINIALASFPDHNAYRDWYSRTIEVDSLLAAMSPMNRAHGRVPTQSALGTVWGQEEGVNRFDSLARFAGYSLPVAFDPPSRLFPSFNVFANLHPDPVTWWLEFLFITNRASFKLCEDQAVRGCRIARLDGNPFLISTAAIDQFTLAPDAPAIDEYLGRMRRACPWLMNSAGELPTPIHPHGIITSPFHKIDPVAVFQCAVELGGVLAAGDAVTTPRPHQLRIIRSRHWDARKAPKWLPPQPSGCIVC
jgi:hypothetical protein